MGWRIKAALLWSLAAHVFLLGWLAGLPDLASRTRASAAPRATVEFEARPAPNAVATAGPPAPANAPGMVIVPPIGPADQLSPRQVSPFPNADVDAPDPRAAGHAGGGTGAPLRYTGRNDQGDLRQQPWNDPDDYRLPRHADDVRRAAPESIARLPRPGLDTQEKDRAPVARAAQPAPRPSPAPAPDGAGNGPPERLAPPAAKAQDGEIAPRTGQPGVAQGARATEADQRGPEGDTTETAQASDEKHPGVIEFTRPSSGGRGGQGVAGPRPGAGDSAAADRNGKGQGGSPQNVATGDGAPSTRAKAQDAYFRKLHQKIEDTVKYPPELALDLEQGELVVSFTLHQDGTVSSVRISRSSGIAAFDDAVVVAVKRAAPFGPVPEAVRGGASSIQVTTPFVFSNPVIR